MNVIKVSMVPLTTNALVGGKLTVLKAFLCMHVPAHAD